MDIKLFFTAPLPRVAGIVSLVSGLVGGGLMTYAFLEAKLTAEFEERLAQEVAGEINFYTIQKPALDSLIVNVDESVEDVVVNVAGWKRDLDNIRSEMGYTSVDSPPEGEKPDDDLTQIGHNVFTNANPEDYFDVIEEAKTRTVEVPYVIDFDEWSSSDLEKTSLVFFDEDGVLADERGAVDNDIVGEHNLLRFGHGSRDNNVVYVRNEALDSEFEVVRNPGSFAEVVLGHQSLRHSSGLRRFRDSDE